MAPRIAHTRPLGGAAPRSALRGRLAEHLEHQLGEAVVQARHDDDHEGHEGHADHRVGDKLLAGGPDHLAKFGDYLPEEQGRRGPVAALGRASGSAPLLRGLTACLSCHILTYRSAGSLPSNLGRQIWAVKSGPSNLSPSNLSPSNLA